MALWVEGQGNFWTISFQLEIDWMTVAPSVVKYVTILGLIYFYFCLFALLSSTLEIRLNQIRLDQVGSSNFLMINNITILGVIPYPVIDYITLSGLVYYYNYHYYYLLGSCLH